LLLLQPRWMGDVLLCTPAVREARRAFPYARIDFVTEAAGGEVLRHNGNLDAVIVPRPGARGRLELLRKIARRRYDAVVDFRSTGSTAQIALLSRAAARIGIRGRGPRNLAYTQLVERLPLTMYAARHKLDMLGGLGVDVASVTDLSLDLYIAPAARVRAARIWEENDLEGSTVVAITPTSREAYKQWGTEKWAAVADEIASRGARVLLTGGPSEAEQLHAVVAAMRSEPVWSYGSTSLEELAALLERCSLWVGNDGGAKHIAVAAGTPTVSVSRWQIGPVWTDAASRVPHGFIDSPPPQGCDLRCPSCEHRGCLAAVGVADVLDRVEAVQFAR
jgi:ADP-heptose:LPS heptosyltransferase